LTTRQCPSSAIAKEAGKPGHILCWVTDYLTSCSQTVVFDGESSNPAPVISEVPQGSAIGPLLFLIYISDLTEINVIDGAKVTLYVNMSYCYKSVGCTPKGH